MIYSKKIIAYCQQYAIMPEDVFFAMLIAAGASKTDAYAAIFRPTIGGAMAIGHLANELISRKPDILELVYAVQKNKGESMQSPSGRRKGGSDTPNQYRDKSSVLAGLEETLPELHGKERADVLMKIADLQQMKKEENAQQEKRVLYYLPLRCNNCDLYVKQKEQKEKEHEEETPV